MADEIAELVVRITGDASGLESTINGVASELSKLEKAQGGGNSVTASGTKGLEAYGQQLQNTGKSIKDFGEGLDTVTKPLQYTAAALATGGVAAAKFAIDFEDSFASVKKTVDGTPEQLDAIKQSIIDMPTVGINGHSAIPMTTAELNELAAAGGQLGIQTENIADFTEVMAQMGTATNLVGEEGAATLARFMNVMGISQGEIRNVGSAIVDLGNNSATTEAEIAAMALRMGKYGSTIGMGAADVLGYSAALSSLGIEAQMGGSAIGRTWLSIESAVASGGDALNAFAKYSGKSAKEFKEQWSTDSKGAFNGLLKGLQSADNLTLALDKLGINNTQDIQAMMALVNGYDLVAESVERANTAYQENTALQAEFDAKAETTASQLAIVKNNFVEAARSVGETMLPTIADASEGIAGFAQKLSSLDDEQKKTLVNTAGGLIAVGAASKGVSASVKGIGNFIEGLEKINKKAPFIMEAASAIKVSAAGMGSTLSALAPVAGAVLAPAAVVAGYKLIAEHVTEAIENNAKLGQSYKELYDTWSKADDNAEHISALRDEYTKLSESINSGELNPEQMESAKQRINAIMEEIKSITGDDTIKLMIDTGDFETALDMAVSEAQDAADEIKDALDLTNNKEPQKAVSNAYDAVGKGSMYGADYKRQQQEMQAWLQSAAQYKEQYKSIIDKMNKAYADGSSTRIKAAALERQSFIDGLKDSDFTEAYKKLTGSEFKFGDMDEVIGQIQNVKNAYSEVSQTIDSMDERAENGRKSLQAMAETATKEAVDLSGFKDMSEVFESGGNAINLVSSQIKSTMSDWGFASQEIAQQVALFRNGFTDLQGAIDNNALDAVISNFVQEGQKLGMTSGEIAQKAALMKNGFSDMQQAIASGNISGVINDLGKLGGDLGMSVEQINALAHSIGLIPDNKHIEITAEGDYSIIEGAAEKIKELDTENVHVFVNAEGDISVLNQATGETQNLQGIGAVSLQVNADGNIDVLDKAGEKIAEIKNDPSATITVNTELGETPDEAPPVDGKANFELGESPKEVPDATGKANFTLGDYPKSIPAITATVNVKQQAKGTQNFPGGLAMVNDQTGIADNRELIIERGRAFIPQGRNVILPLSKGAKVYTAAQTKAIMSGLGIPHYAEGKNNSDAFTAAKDDWTHYTKTHAVTTSQELEKWLELQKQFKDNEKDIWDIEEQIFSLQQKITQELNEQSKAYIEERSALNDWDEYGDSAAAAFDRVRERNLAEVEAQRMTWEEFSDTMSDIGSDMYQDRISQSEKWLEHEEKYNGMSAADYLAGINRMRQYTEEYYAQGIISHREYVESKIELDEMYLDKAKELLSEQFDISKAYIGERTYFNDWGDNGDDPLAAYNRVMDRHREALANGELTQEEFDKYAKELGSDMFSERKEQSINWLEEQRKYFGMSDEEYVEGLERIKKYTQQYYDWGLISRQEYNEAMTELNHSAWDEAESAYEDMLSQQQEYISDLREQFQKQEQALQDSWTVEDRAADMADVQNQLEVYAGAVTDRGQQKYKELQEQMKQLQRDEELYQLQVANNAVIESMEADYKRLEEDKAVFLKEIVTNTDIDVSGIVGDLTRGIEQSGDNITQLLGQLLKAFNNVQLVGPSYNNNSQITINSADMVDIMAILKERNGV